MFKFPQDFLWGAATSSYQVEGDNNDSDWWEWERKAGLREVSGQACRHYQLYKDDFRLAKELNHNAHRLSVEWSRIEPREGEFSSRQLGHYRDVLLSLRELGIEPVVTLHHFTNPLWFADMGGWLDKRSSRFFLRFVDKVVNALCDKVSFWVTINEPMVYAYQSYILGSWPPQEKSFSRARKVVDNLLAMHIGAYRAIHSIYINRKLATPFVSIAKNMQDFVPCGSSLANRFAAHLRNKYFNLEFIERLIKAGSLDFIGVNYYTRSLVDIRGWGFKNLLLDVCNKGHSKLAKNSLGWDIYPQGIYNMLFRLKKYKLPVFILENGICTGDDDARWGFIYEHLKNVGLAINQGVKVLGYIYWSLMDNYEWDKGFSPRFGLIQVDYNNYGRLVRESARKFARVCETGTLQQREEK